MPLLPSGPHWGRRDSHAPAQARLHPVIAADVGSKAVASRPTGSRATCRLLGVSRSVARTHARLRRVGRGWQRCPSAAAIRGGRLRRETRGRSGYRCAMAVPPTGGPGKGAPVCAQNAGDRPRHPPASPGIPRHPPGRRPRIARGSQTRRPAAAPGRHPGGSRTVRHAGAQLSRFCLATRLTGTPPSGSRAGGCGLPGARRRRAPARRARSPARRGACRPRCHGA